MQKLVNIIFTIIFVATIFIACDDTTLSTDDLPEENLSYSEHIQPILTVYCSRTGCHGAESMAGGYGTYDWIATNTPPYVLEGNPENSLAYMAMSGKGGISLMPPLESNVRLDDKEIEAFRKWIEEGAKNN